MEPQLVACVTQSLACNLYSNAIFVCERLVAEFPSPANSFLLATCFFRSDQAFRAHHVLSTEVERGNKLSPQARFLLAQSCVALGKLPEAEQVLKRDPSGIPLGAPGYYLLGQVCKLQARHQDAVEHFRVALTLDPLFWCAFQELCDAGADDEALAWLSLSPSQQAEGREEASMQTGPSEGEGTAPPRPPDRGSDRGFQPYTPRHHVLPGVNGTFVDPTAYVTPSPFGGQFGGSIPPPPQALPRIAERQAPSRMSFEADTPAQQQEAPPVGGPGGYGRGVRGTAGWKVLEEGKARRLAGRLFHETPGSAAKEQAPRGDQTAQQPPRWRSFQVIPAPPEGPPRWTAPGPAPTGGAIVLEGGDWGEPQWGEGHDAALALLQSLGRGYQLLTSHASQEAIEEFGRLSQEQYSTGWVLCCIGRACFESVDYEQAAKAFQWARQADPCRLEGLEVYSTVLWHLKREVEAAHLAQDAIALDRRSPAAWATMGNCFSLQKEHEAALRFFQRALQLDPTFAYAYTLCGHEYYANEDFDKGLQCYRNAIRLDPRHYIAWYGVGQIHFRQEKYEMAEYHFERSLTINPRSSVLRCYLGMAHAKRGHVDTALALLTEAIAADPANPLAKFERAGVLLQQERFLEAQAEMESLRDLVPREASVWFQLGKIHKRLRQADQALQCYRTALDLKPSATDINLIKTAMERLHMSLGQEDEEEC